MISVVIPAYQAAPYISDTIRSVQGQTLPGNEIIVVDDGSRDETGKIAESLGARVIRQVNKGVASARNVGIRAAQNEWIALIDADDLWERDKLERQWKATKLCPEAAVVTCNHTFFDEEKVWGDTYLARLGKDYHKAGRIEIATGVALFENARFQEINWIVPSPSSLFVRRDVFDTIGYFDEQLNGVDDTEFYLRVMGHFPFVFLEEPLTRYRQVPSSLGRNRLHCGAAFLRTIDKISANPEMYPQGVCETAIKVRPRRLAGHGRTLLSSGYFGEAERALCESLQKQFRPITFLLWLASIARLRI